MESLRSCIFLVMCDEYTDVFNKEQFTFCMHSVNNELQVSENFLRFYKVPDIKSSTMVTVMKNILLRYQINRDMCRGQCYGGASNMLWKSSAVASQIFAEQPKALYTLPCSFTITFGNDVTKNTKILRGTMGTAEEVTIPIKYSPKRKHPRKHKRTN